MEDKWLWYVPWRGTREVHGLGIMVFLSRWLEVAFFVLPIYPIFMKFKNLMVYAKFQIKFFSLKIYYDNLNRFVIFLYARLGNCSDSFLIIYSI